MEDQLNQLAILSILDPLPPPLGWILPIGFLDEIDLALIGEKRLFWKGFRKVVIIAEIDDLSTRLFLLSI